MFRSSSSSLKTIGFIVLIFIGTSQVPPVYAFNQNRLHELKKGNLAIKPINLDALGKEVSLLNEARIRNFQRKSSHQFVVPSRLQNFLESILLFFRILLNPRISFTLSLILFGYVVANSQGTINNSPSQPFRIELLDEDLKLAIDDNTSIRTFLQNNPPIVVKDKFIMLHDKRDDSYIKYQGTVIFAQSVIYDGIQYLRTDGQTFKTTNQAVEELLKKSNTSTTTVLIVAYNGGKTVATPSEVGRIEIITIGDNVEIDTKNANDLLDPDKPLYISGNNMLLHLSSGIDNPFKGLPFSSFFLGYFLDATSNGLIKKGELPVKKGVVDIEKGSEDFPTRQLLYIIPEVEYREDDPPVDPYKSS